MSKASEWASEWAKAKPKGWATARPRFVATGPSREYRATIAHVADEGDALFMLAGPSGRCVRLSRDESLALARWILDTFGEPDTA